MSSTHPPDPQESDKLQESSPPPEKTERGDASTAASQEAAVSVSARIEYSPFPHPVLLGQYKALDPGLLNDVREMAVRQQKHQHAMDHRRLDAASRSEARGAYISLISVLGTLGLAGALLATGNTLASLPPLLVPLAFLVRVLFSGSRRRSNEQHAESQSAGDAAGQP